MSSLLTIVLNGQIRQLEALSSPATLEAVIAVLGLKPDRIAVELNGNIVRRAAWPETAVPADARLEIVHFVGGGRPSA